MLTPSEQFSESLGMLAWSRHPVPCQATPGDDHWISEDPDRRAQAVEGCQPCPLAADCRAEADRTRAVWGAVDYSPTTRKKTTP